MTITPIRRSSLEPTMDLPDPPDDSEKYLYLAAKKRWVLLAQAAAFAVIAYSTVRFIVHIPYTEIFFVPLTISTLWAVVSFATTFPSRRDNRPSHDLKVTLYHPERYPSVDVFLPSCGEPLAVLDNTYHWVSALDWPGELNVYVMDDAASTEVKDLAHNYGFHYFVRDNRGHMKKAGNLRWAFERTSGDVIAIFDADFCPRSDFLRELMPYMDEKDVGIVQSPQYFDVHDRQNWLQASAGASQEYFYRWVQPGRDRSNGAICVGTNALYRREALNRSGGFAQIGHSEDVHTGVNMNKVGYRTRYVPVQLAKGLCPDNLNQFISQQYRWCAGSMSLLFSKEFHRTPMPLLQRLCFWSGFLYYISTAIEIFCAPLPPIIMGWAAPQWVRPRNYILILIAVTIWFFIHPVITTGRGRRTGVARAQIVYSFAHGRALYDIIRSRPAEWVPTGVKRGTALSTKVRITMIVYLTAVQAAIWSAIAIHAPHFGWNLWWPMVIFAATNLYLVTPLIFGIVRVPRPKTVHLPEHLSEHLPHLPYPEDAAALEVTA